MLLISLDVTVVNVALPSIRSDFDITATSLAWVVNAYLLTFGGLLLLGGRLGDVFGHHRIFLAGIFIFTLSSLGCGLARSAALLTVTRAAQGIGGALLSSGALSTILIFFSESPERVRALAVYSFVNTAGGSIGLLVGGTLIHSLGWRSIFLINVPVGVSICVLCIAWLPKSRPNSEVKSLDLGGSVTLTAAQLLAIYATLQAGDSGWLSCTTLSALGSAGLLVVAFISVERRSATPLLPSHLLAVSHFRAASVIAAFWAAAMFSWLFESTLYLQTVLNYTPNEVAFTFLPCNMGTAATSLGVSFRLVDRFGSKAALAAGLLLATGGFGLFLVSVAADGESSFSIVASMMLVGIGGGIVSNPLFLVAIDGVQPDNIGIASSTANATLMMGGSLGLAVVASIAATFTSHLTASSYGQTGALTAGYLLAFSLSVLCAMVAAAVACVICATAGKPVQRGANLDGPDT